MGKTSLNNNFAFTIIYRTLNAKGEYYVRFVKTGNDL